MPGTLDDLDTPLHEVTFCVVDLETTGGSPGTCAITEVGAAKFRGGECLGTFQTLVDPGASVEPAVSALTGITDAMLVGAPPARAVLPALLEFMGGAVLVGHNLRFDAAFLDAALRLGERSPLRARRVDTVALARRLLHADEVPDHRLATLAAGLGLDHRPSHRALADVMATADLLHALIERAAGFGVTGLDDLLTLPRLASHRHAAKLRLTARLPRAPGVHVFRDRHGAALHVGHAANLRRQVRRYFVPDGGARTASLLRQLAAVDHLRCSSALEAAVLRVRLAHALDPPYNRHGSRRRSPHDVVLVDEPLPRLVVTRAAGRRALARIGPFATAGAARAAAAAIESAVPDLAVDRPLAARDEAPAGGDCTPSGVDGAVEAVAQGLGGRPHRLLGPLEARMQALAGRGRYAEAATARRHIGVLVAALERQEAIDGLRRAGRMVLTLPDGAGVELCRGRLMRAWGADGSPGPATPVTTATAATAGPATPATTASAGDPGPPGAVLALLATVPVEPPRPDGPLPLDVADELWAVATWLVQQAARLRPVEVEGELASPLPRLLTPPSPDTPLTAPSQHGPVPG